MFYGHAVHFTVYILWTFGTDRGNLVYFSRFAILYQKNLATLQSRGELEILETSCQQDAKVSMLH
jgi:hypothetical protein